MHEIESETESTGETQDMEEGELEDREQRSKETGTCETEVTGKETGVTE